MYVFRTAPVFVRLPYANERYANEPMLLKGLTLKQSFVIKGKEGGLHYSGNQSSLSFGDPPGTLPRPLRLTGDPSKVAPSLLHTIMAPLTECDVTHVLTSSS